MKTSFYNASEPIKKLKALNFFIPERKAILAGGALRDDYMGEACNITDYDIFIKDISELFPSDVEGSTEDILTKVFPREPEIIQLFDSAYLTIEEQEDEQGDVKPGPNDQVVSVWEIIEDDLAYQVVFTKGDPIDHINKYFDIGFCKAYCDGVKIRYTDDFLCDARNKTLTIVGDNMTKEQVEYAVYHHADKIQYKYDGFRIVVPPRYQKFVQDQNFPTC